MRHFEQVVLVSEDGTRTIVERRYSTGEVEYWSLMSIAFRDQQHQGTAQVPFQILPTYPAEHLGKFENREDVLKAAREQAFEEFDAALEAAKPDAHESVKRKVIQATKQEQSKIVLANSLPHVPVQ